MQGMFQYDQQLDVEEHPGEEMANSVTGGLHLMLVEGVQGFFKDSIEPLAYALGEVS